MGGLAGKMPVTHMTMLIATIAIAGIPPFAGFFSKDEILAAAFASGHYPIWIAGMIGAVMTAFYMFRLYILTFRGEQRFSEQGGTDAHGHDASPSEVHGHAVHESPAAMTIPLVILAVLSIIGGFVGLPFQEGGHLLDRWLRPVLESAGDLPLVSSHHLSHATEWGLIGLSVAIAAFGIFMAFRAYLQRPGLATALQQRFAGLHHALLHKYWVDEFYDAIAVTPIYRLSQWLWRFFDERVVDGIVNGVGYTLEGGSAILRLFQTGYVGTYALFITLGVLALFLHLLRS